VSGGPWTKVLIYLGSHKNAGPKVAAILSVVESCPCKQIPIRDSLATVLPGLAYIPIRRLASPTHGLGHQHPATPPLSNLRLL
jgi:hypothetical protein